MTVGMRDIPLLEYVADIPYAPQYAQMGRQGAIGHLLMNPLAASRLRAARALVRQSSRLGRRYDLVVWDGYRPFSVQLEIFNDYLDQLISQGLTSAAAKAAAVTFVRHPDGVYPHGTGGTVDLTLSVNGMVASMGTGFDDFTAHAHRLWYEEHPPRTFDDHEARDNRQILNWGMTQAGFVGIPEEWWHYEWGTQYWASVTGQPVVLTGTIAKPAAHQVVSCYRDAPVVVDDRRVSGGR